MGVNHLMVISATSNSYSAYKLVVRILITLRSKLVTLCEEWFTLRFVGMATNTPGLRLRLKNHTTGQN